MEGRPIRRPLRHPRVNVQGNASSTPSRRKRPILSDRPDAETVIRGPRGWARVLVSDYVASGSERSLGALWKHP